MAHGIELQVVKLAEAKKGFVLLPKRWVVERSFAWAARPQRLAKDYERLPDVLRGLHFLVFAILMLPKAIPPITATRNAQHALIFALRWFAVQVVPHRYRHGGSKVPACDEVQRPQSHC